MKKGQRVRIKTEELISELLHVNKWRQEDYVTGEINDVVGERIGVTIDGKVLWFNSDKVEKDEYQPRLPGVG